MREKERKMREKILKEDIGSNLDVTGRCCYWAFPKCCHRVGHLQFCCRYILAARVLKISISEDKCVLLIVVLVVSLDLIPFFSTYHFLFTIDYPELTILALLWEVMNPTHACSTRSIIAASWSNYYLHNQILNWHSSLKLQWNLCIFTPV